MKHRCHIEFLGHTNIQVTAFNYQKTYDLVELKRGDKQIDLITAKVISRADKVPLKLEIDYGDGNLGNPFNLLIIAETRKGMYETVDRLTLYTSREKTVEIDLP